MDRISWPSRAEAGPDAMFDEFCAQVAPLEAAASPVGVGVSIGGPLDPESGRIFSPPHLPGWDDFPLGVKLSARFSCPIRVEHDAVACLLAEHLWGAARGAGHAAYLTAGTGCGMGLILGGQVVRGPNGETTEIGHLRLKENGPVTYDKAGSVEAFCSGTGIAQLAAFLHPSCYPAPVPLPELVEQAGQGIREAVETLRQSARGMGQVCAWLSDLFCLEKILIGSLARYLPGWWLDAVRQEFCREILPGRGTGATIQPAALGDRLQDLSALAPCLSPLRGGLFVPGRGAVS